MRRATGTVLKAIHRTLGPLLPPRMLAYSRPGIPGLVHVDDRMLRSEARAMADRFGDTLSLIRFAERGWDAHQDVWSYQRAGRSRPVGDRERRG